MSSHFLAAPTQSPLTARGLAAVVRDVWPWRIDRCGEQVWLVTDRELGLEWRARLPRLVHAIEEVTDV